MTDSALPTSIDDTQARLLALDYVADRPLAVGVFLALKLQRPLFLEGEPGTGKTEIARTLARMLGTDLIRLQCHEGLDMAGAAYEWNYGRQMMEIRLAEGTGASRTALAASCSTSASSSSARCCRPSTPRNPCHPCC